MKANAGYEEGEVVEDMERWKESWGRKSVTVLLRRIQTRDLNQVEIKEEVQGDSAVMDTQLEEKCHDPESGQQIESIIKSEGNTDEGGATVSPSAITDDLDGEKNSPGPVSNVQPYLINYLNDRVTPEAV